MYTAFSAAWAAPGHIPATNPEPGAFNIAAHLERGHEMRWRGGNQYGNVEDRRGQGGGFGMGGMGGGGGPIRLGGGGLLGLIAVVAIAYFFGVDPSQFLSGDGGVSSQPGKVGQLSDEGGKFVDVITSSTTDVWRAQFQKMGRTYQPPAPTVLYTQATRTDCGIGQAQMGPFYCPNDRRVYLDLDFFNELSSRFGAPGDFARAYVIAHEIGHHVQTLLGTGQRVREQQQASGSEGEANRYSVMLELQADCYAGVWAAHASEVSNGQVALEKGDLEDGLRAAAAVGDDTLQRQTQGTIIPDSFTHGSAEQRQHWLHVGYDTGDPNACNTFAGAE